MRNPTCSSSTASRCKLEAEAAPAYTLARRHADANSLLLTLLQALSELHVHGWGHGDVKASNIFVDFDELQVVKVVLIDVGSSSNFQGMLSAQGLALLVSCSCFLL